MKRYLAIIPLAVMGLALASCTPKALVKEDISSTAAPSKDAKAQEGADKKDTVVVPDEKTMSEDITAENLRKAAAKNGAAQGSADALAARKENGLAVVHFDFDKYTIRDEDKSVLTSDAQWIRLHNNVRVRIAGHCDERGDTEYNLALGEKRAESVKKYLEAMGVKDNRLSTVSYGKEKPLDQGHNEDAWSKNRRAEFYVIK